MAKIAENVKFVDDLQQALRESLAVFPGSELKSEQKLTIENIVGRRDVFGQLPTVFGKSVTGRKGLGHRTVSTERHDLIMKAYQCAGAMLMPRVSASKIVDDRR